MFLDLGGTIRASSPAETLAWLKPMLPTYGITRVMGQHGLGDLKIPVSISCRPNSRFLSTSQGKGITRELADISAIMESVEGFHAERVPPPVVTATVDEMRRSGQRFVEPASLSRLPGAEGRDNYPVGWIHARHLASGEPMLVPRCYLSTDQCEPRQELATLGLNVSTNGLASGNTHEEALLHGLYELIERHCLYEHRCTFTAEQRLDRRVILDSLHGANPHIETLLGILDESGMTLSVRSMHGDLGIPCFTVFVRPTNPADRTSGAGHGAHYIPEIALSRAITEAVQSRVTYISGSRDDTFPRDYHDIDDQPPPLLDDEIPCRLALSDVPRPPTFASLSEALSWTRARLELRGFTETCVYSYQRAEYGDVPVVKVMSPGLKLDRPMPGVTIRADH
jgi:ribosomal protein S12 methylthiotransferase accessory factor